VWCEGFGCRFGKFHTEIALLFSVACVDLLFQFHENVFMSDICRKHIHYYVLCVGAFAAQKNIPHIEAFNYLYKYKGIEFLVDCYEAEHTLSLNDAVEDLSIVCRSNGGTIT
jgi:hypothetical protein